MRKILAVLFLSLSVPVLASTVIRGNNSNLVNADASGNLNTVDTQGNAGSNAQAWWVRLGDATNGPAAVKAASTSAAATDPSLVVQLSPNQPGLTTPLNVKVVGNAGAAFDAPSNGTAPANVVVAGAQLQSGAQPTAGTAGQVGNVLAGLDHVLYTRQGGPVLWTCSLAALAATLTQCQAAPAAGLKLYVGNIAVQTTTTTSGTFALQAGTGTNCATGTAAIFPSSSTSARWTAPISTSPTSFIPFFTALSNVPAANALCVIGTATNTINIQISGFTAP